MKIADKLWLYILIGMLAGAVVGFAIAPDGLALIPATLAETISGYFKLLGQIFLGLITMVIVPLVVFSIILGINSSKDAGFVKSLGLRLVPYFACTSFVAITIGILLAQFIAPGHLVDATAIGAVAIEPNTFSDLTIPERMANLIPTNPFQAILHLDLLQIVIASVLVGLAVLGLNKERMAPFKDFCQAGQDISMRIIEWAMAFAPIAVFGLMADLAIKMGPQAFVGLGGYVFTVLVGLICVLFMYAVIVSVLARRNPLAFFKGIRTAQIIAFSTSSSAATMPVSMEVAEDNLKVRPEISRMTIPLGATINMDGTGIYQAIAAVFLCQFFGVDLSFTELFMLSLTIVGASIGTPATPGVGIVVLATIMTGLGVPAQGIGMILGVDRILDMCRTAVNVTGDLTATTVMNRWLRQA